MAFDVQNIYSTPQIPRKRQCLRPRRMTLIDLRNVRVDEDDEPYRKSSTATIRSEGTGTQYYNRHGGIQPLSDSDNSSIDSYKSNVSQMRIRRVSSSFDSTSRFPKLQECAHFHYDVVELPELKVCLCNDEQENCHHNGEDYMERTFLVKVICSDKSWNVKRTYKNFRMLDRQLHKCIFDRRFSRLPDLQTDEDGSKTYEEMENLLQFYLQRLSDIAGSMINCGSILNWFELDNRGNRLLIVDDTGINTPAIAAAHAIKRYTAQAVDEISLEVGDIVSVIDMPSPDDTMWWRGKRGFEVGFFPSECVEVIGEKVPASVQSRIPMNSNSKKPLVRKHGKFLSFLRMFFSTRPARIQLKQSGIVKERVFGCDLGEHLLNSGHDVPLVLKCCSDIIEEYGIVDGIYRLSGITSNIQKLRHAFDEDRIPDLTEEMYLQDIHSISSLLKMYFRELPNPLLTYQLYDKFAAAVRDEDNKLLKIHDVVQQLPPPHYRTTEYLMRHLAKVAAFGNETGMHSKNLAIVWAPNLLRSKELECGGGAAALQGVGIQAVVTECLILYADLIFSDKMPSYSSPELRQSRKKPRPKSLAISTPTKLITLEEARERALSASLRPPPQKYIDVGGGPKNLPDRYHTVIDLPGYRKKIPLKDVGNINKAKKSPSGWRSIFSKSARQGSIKHKGHKGSMPDTSSVGMLERKAITEEDVHNWKRRRLRGAKSAESLLAMPSSSLDTRRMSRLIDENMLMKMYADEDERGTRHKRSLSSESPRSLMHSEHSVSYPSFIVAGSREVPIDVDSSKIANETKGSESTSPDNATKRKQSFVRNETKRRVVNHRRTPSAPSTPRQDSPSREKSRSPKLQKQKTPSQMVVDGEHKVKAGISSDLMSSSVDAEKFVLHIDDVKLLKPTDPSRKGSVNSSNEDLHEKHRGSKTPPRDRKESKTPPRERRRNRDERKDRNTATKDERDSKRNEEVVTIDLPESPGAKRKNWLGSASSTPASTPDEPPVHYYFSRHHDYAEILSEDEDLARNRRLNGESKNYAMDLLDNGSESTNLSANVPMNLNRLSDSYDNVPDAFFYLPHSETDSVGLNTQNVHTIYSSQNPQRNNAHSDFHLCDSKPKENIPPFKIAKCLSVPSDIQKSLENMTSGSQTDLLSSVTISELSTSVDSFNFSSEDPSLPARSRRSTSLDNITEKSSPITRTLMEINAQIDQAFKQEPNKDRKYRPETNRSEGLMNSSSDIPQGQRSSKDMTGTYVDRPVAEVQIIETPRVIRAPLRPKTSPQSKSAKLITQSSHMDSSLSMEAKLVSSNQTSSLHSSVQDTHSLQYSQSTHISSKSEVEHSYAKETSSVHMTSPKQIRSPTPDQAFLKELCSPTGSPSQLRNQSGKFFSPVTSPMDEHSVPRGLANQSPTQSRHRESPLTSPVLNRTGDAHQSGAVQRRPRRSPATTPTQGQGQSWYQQSPSSSPGQGHPRSGHSSPFMSPSSPEQSRLIKSQSRHGKVTFDLSEEDLHFLSEQGRKRESFQRSDSQLSDSSSITSSPESKSKQTQSKEDFQQRQPAKRDFPQLLLSSTSGPDTNNTSSPRSPRQQPRWEDLAGLNQDFRAMAGLDTTKMKSKDSVKCKNVSKSEDTASPVQDDSFDKKLQDLSNFNDIWRRQLAPTGDVCRLNEREDGSSVSNIPSEKRSEESEPQAKPHLKKSSTIAAMEMAMEYQHPSQTRERTPECGMEEQTLVLEKPMIKKCLTESDIPQIKHCSIMTQDSASTTSSSGTSDLHSASQVTGDFYNSNRTSSEVGQNGRTQSLSDIHHRSCDRVMMERPVLQQSGSRDEITADSRLGAGFIDPPDPLKIEEKIEAPKPSKIQKVDPSNKPVVLDLPVLPPLELSGFPQFENSNLTHITGASVGVHQNNTSGIPAATRGACAADATTQDGTGNLNVENFSFADERFGMVKPSDQSDDSETRRRQAFNEGNNASAQPMMDEIDFNESCFGIPTHQNLSNEMREKVQERLKAAKDQYPTRPSAESSNFQGMEGVQMGSFIYQQQSERAVHMGYELGEDEGQIQSSQRMEVEATMQFSSELSSVSLPVEDLQILSQGPTITAEACIVEQLQPSYQASVPLDNSEEAAQNAINADRELSMTLQSSLGQGKNIDEDDQSEICQNFEQDTCTPSGLEHMKLVSPSMGISSNDNLLPELAPPEREFMEISRPSVIKPVQKQARRNLNSSRQRKEEKHKSKKKEESSSERGEDKVVIEHRASFKKKVPVPLPSDKSSRTSRPKEELCDYSDINDDVFVDDIKSTITHSKLVATRHKSVVEKCSSPVHSFLNEPPNRSSLDDSVLQMAAIRHDDFSNDDSDDKKEDIRFTRAHKSAKLQSLKELFEKSCEDKQKEKSDSQDRKSVSQERNLTSQEGLVCLTNVVPSVRKSEPNVNLESSRVSGARSAFAQYRSHSQTIDRSNIESARSRQSPTYMYDRSFNQEDFNLPRSRRSISTDVGYEFRSARYETTRGDRYEKQHVGSGKPPKHRSTSRTRTPSESSLGESEYRVCSTRGSPKSPRQDGSPRSYREGSLSSKSSPKSQRDSPPLSQLSGDDSPATLRHRSEGSPRGARHVSFQKMDSSENSPKSPRSWGSPGSRRSVTMETSDSQISERMTQSCTLPSSHSRSSPVSRRPVSMDTNDAYMEDLMSRSLTLSSSQSENCEETRLERRGSIKELMHFFESKTEGCEEEISSTSQRKLSHQRVQSVSPTIGLGQSESRSHESLSVINVRHSLELPSGTSLSSLEAVVQPQPVRMGPKPFYGARK